MTELNPPQKPNATRMIAAMTCTKLGDVLIYPKTVLTWLLTQTGASRGVVALLVPVRDDFRDHFDGGGPCADRGEGGGRDLVKDSTVLPVAIELPMAAGMSLGKSIRREVRLLTAIHVQQTQENKMSRPPGGDVDGRPRCGGRGRRDHLSR